MFLRPQVGVQDEQQTHQEREDVGDAQRRQGASLVVDCHPVRGTKQSVDRPGTVGQFTFRRVVDQRPAFRVDTIAEAHGVAAEFITAPEYPAMLFRQRLAARFLYIFREPACFQWLEPGSGFAVLAVPRTNDVIDEIALVIDQHLLGRDHRRHVAFHDVVVMEFDDLAGSTERRAEFAIPDREQHVAMRGQENAQLRIQPVPVGGLRRQHQEL